jgi:hypothetical protein
LVQSASPRGSASVQNSFAQQELADATMAFEPDGVRCTVSFSAIAQASDDKSETEVVEQGSDPTCQPRLRSKPTAGWILRKRIRPFIIWTIQISSKLAIYLASRSSNLTSTALSTHADAMPTHFVAAKVAQKSANLFGI